MKIPFSWPFYVPACVDPAASPARAEALKGETESQSWEPGAASGPQPWEGEPALFDSDVRLLVSGAREQTAITTRG